MSRALEYMTLIFDIQIGPPLTFMHENKLKESNQMAWCMAIITFLGELLLHKFNRIPSLGNDKFNLACLGVV